MHRPPAVSHAAGRSRWHAFLLLGLWLSALGLVACFFLFQESHLSLALLVTAWLASGWFALRAWYASPVGLLQWDGEQWLWLQGGIGGDAQACSLSRVRDFQYCVLLQIRTTEGQMAWLWLEPGKNLSQWIALRRAIVSRDNGFTEPSSAADLEGLR